MQASKKPQTQKSLTSPLVVQVSAERYGWLRPRSSHEWPAVMSLKIVALESL